MLSLTPTDRDLLVRWTRAATTQQRVFVRSAVVLLAASGVSDAGIARDLGVTRRTVATWRRRFAQRGPQVLLADAPGRGRKKGRDARLVTRILHATRHESPTEGDRWTVRSLARHVGVSHATVHRVWREHDVSAGQPGAAAIGETSRDAERA